MCLLVGFAGFSLRDFSLCACWVDGVLVCLSVCVFLRGGLMMAIQFGQRERESYLLLLICDTVI